MKKALAILGTIIGVVSGTIAILCVVNNYRTRRYTD